MPNFVSLKETVAEPSALLKLYNLRTNYSVVNETEKSQHKYCTRDVFSVKIQ